MGELALAVAAGIGATITPCVLPLYPAFIAYVTAPEPVAGGGVALRGPSRPRLSRNSTSTLGRLPSPTLRQHHA